VSSSSTISNICFSHFGGVSRGVIVNAIVREIVQVLGNKILDKLKQRVCLFKVMAAEFLLYLEILISTRQDTGEKYTSSSVA
jgi:hypothetical protein